MDFPLTLRRAWSELPPLQGRLKVDPEDFVVDEVLGFDLSGSGEHLYLRLRKINQNTHWVAEQLARLAGVGPRDVGYAGRKDRYAVTSQWFSLPVAEVPDVAAIPGCELLEAGRHLRKLRPGDHQGNAFCLRVRELQGDQERALQLVEQIKQQGFPNYFGAQRFGHDGANLQQGWAALQEGRRLTGRQGGMYLSALRSWLFNQVLDAQIGAGHWPGIGAAEADWTGPLWGRGRARPAEAETAIEEALVSGYAELCHRLEFCGLQQERRPLRARADRLSLVDVDATSLTLSFQLQGGQFATSLLRELMQEVVD